MWLNTSELYQLLQWADIFCFTLLSFKQLVLLWRFDYHWAKVVLVDSRHLVNGFVWFTVNLRVRVSTILGWKLPHMRKLSSFCMLLCFCIEGPNVINKEKKLLQSQIFAFSARSYSPNKAADWTTKSCVLLVTSSLSRYLLISLLGLFSWKGSKLWLGKFNRQNWAQQLERQREPCRKHGKDEWLCW